MLKMETTLHLLNEEVSKLNQAMALAAETLAVQQKLQAAQAQQKTVPEQAPLSLTAASAPPPPRNDSPNWQELVLSALAGGAIASLVAHYLSAWRQKTSQRERLHARAHAEFQAAVPRSTVFAPPAPDIPQATPAIPPEISRKAEATPGPLTDIGLEPSSNFGTETSSETAFEEEISALDLAELMISFGRIKGAADTLANYIEESHPQNIRPWLMLLDLYRRGNMRDEFEALASHTKERFNTSTPLWEDSSTPVSGLKSLEDYAHIISRVQDNWGTQECLDFLYDLVKDNRSGQRSGFPLEVVEEIALLMRILEDSRELRRTD